MPFLNISPLATLAEVLNTTETDATALLTNDSTDWRWYPAGSPPKVMIVSRTSGSKRVICISKSGRLRHLYPSWEPVLAELARRKAAKGVKRLSHKGLTAGDVP